MTMSSSTSQEGHEVTFRWPSTDAQVVLLSGDFDRWSNSVTMTKDATGFEATVKVPWGVATEYKFLVDGQWRYLEDKPTEQDPSGRYTNNVYNAPSKPASAVTSAFGYVASGLGGAFSTLTGIGYGAEFEPKPKTKEVSPPVESSAVLTPAAVEMAPDIPMPIVPVKDVAADMGAPASVASVIADKAFTKEPELAAVIPSLATAPAAAADFEAVAVATTSIPEPVTVKTPTAEPISLGEERSTAPATTSESEINTHAPITFSKVTSKEKLNSGKGVANGNGAIANGNGAVVKENGSGAVKGNGASPVATETAPAANPLVPETAAAIATTGFIAEPAAAVYMTSAPATLAPDSTPAAVPVSAAQEPITAADTKTTAADTEPESTATVAADPASAPATLASDSSPAAAPISAAQEPASTATAPAEPSTDSKADATLPTDASTTLQTPPQTPEKPTHRKFSSDAAASGARSSFSKSGRPSFPGSGDDVTSSPRSLSGSFRNKRNSIFGGKTPSGGDISSPSKSIDSNGTHKHGIYCRVKHFVTDHKEKAPK